MTTTDLTAWIDAINREATALITPTPDKATGGDAGGITIRDGSYWDALCAAAQDLVTVREMARERAQA